MTVAAAYLRSFVENNVKGAACTNPPDISKLWNLSLTDFSHPTDEIDENLDEPDTRPPQPVRISGKQRARGTGQQRGRGTRRGPGEQVVVAPAEEPVVAAPAEEQEVSQEGTDLAAVAPVVRDEASQRKTKRAKFADVPIPEGATLGCSSCRRSRVGCAACRAKSFIFQEMDGSFVFRPPR